MARVASFARTHHQRGRDGGVVPVMKKKPSESDTSRLSRHVLEAIDSGIEPTEKPPCHADAEQHGREALLPGRN
jgi:hypothetical protein